MTARVADLVRIRSRRAEARRAFWRVGTLAIVLLFLWRWWTHGHQSREKTAIQGFETKLRTLRWIAYDPPALKPYAEIWPTEGEIRKDLSLLTNHFDGLITFSSTRTNG